MKGFFIMRNEKTDLEILRVQILNERLIVNPYPHNHRIRSRHERQLFKALVSYARENYLRIQTTNSSVYNRLNQDPDQYADIWDQNS